MEVEGGILTPEFAVGMSFRITSAFAIHILPLIICVVEYEEGDIGEEEATAL